MMIETFYSPARIMREVFEDSFPACVFCLFFVVVVVVVFVVFVLFVWLFVFVFVFLLFVFCLFSVKWRSAYAH